MSDTIDVDDASDIAIIGMNCRFPGAGNVEEFWQNLVQGVESIARFEDDEILAAGVDGATLEDPAFVKAGGVLPDVDLFDAAFFGINPREAQVLDPQQRLLLECAWECLEHAGYDPAACPGLVGVYTGAAMSSYLGYVYGAPELVLSVGEMQVALGNDKDSIPTIVSYKLNLKGPSMAVQTACSTSLVAVGVACQSLLSYQCDLAIAGGVRIVLPQAAGYLFQEGGILSPDGHCRAFDARARGTVGGNGVGLVALKRLQDAIGDGDCIHAVIKGSAVNNDGSLKVGYTAPSVEGQAQVVAMALAAGGVDPRTVTYVEGHGTGTDLGDPIEVAALTQAFRLGTDDSGFCALGSVKSNIGHLDTAAGVAGLIKTVLSLEHATLPPSLHFEQPNPEIDFEGSPFYVNHRVSPWPAAGGPRRAGVSSFGIGGTNAHVVVEEAPKPTRHPSHRRAHLLLLSARSAQAVDRMGERLGQHFVRHPEVDLADAAFTLQVGRSAFPYRRALVCQSLADATDALARSSRPHPPSRPVDASPPPLAFMFAGQGTQHVHMAAGLYRHEPTFRDELDRCADLLTPHLGLDLRRILYPSAAGAADAGRKLDQTALAQPALFAIELALARLWLEWGVRPRAMIGHSIGEYVAACLSGVFGVEDALKLVAARGRLMQELPGGAMLAVVLPEHELVSYLEADVSLAATNAPGSCVASGSVAAIAALEARLNQEGVASQRLRTSHAFHSAAMEPIVARFRDLVGSTPRRAPQIPFVSNLTGTWITDAEATDPDYWARHLRRTVRFSAGLECLRAEHTTLLEIGPGQTLCGLARQQDARAPAITILASLPGSREGSLDDDVFLMGTLGRLWVSGTNIDWAAFHRHAPRLRTPLPTYPFERQRYWVEPRDPDDDVAAVEEPGSPRTPDMADWFYFPSWRRSAPCAAFAPAPTRGRWLVFAGSSGMGQALVREAVAAGVETVVVRPGPAFEKLSDNSFTVNPDRAADFEELLADLRADSWAPDAIVHTWGVTSGASAQDPLAELDTCLALGFSSLVKLAQALGARGQAEPVRIVVVSNQVHDLTGQERLSAAKATVLGACRVIPEEYPGVSCRHVDVDWPAADAEREAAMVESLLAEVGAETSDTNVALRGPHRWVQVFEPIRLEQQDDTVLRDRGVYLITGGMGGIGFTLAEHLARTHRARLVLVGRRSFPARGEWDRILADRAEDDPTSARIRVLRELERTGAEIVLEAGDVADAEAMRAIVSRALARFGSIHGVVHCAGVAGGRMIQFHAPEDAARVIRPKAIGALTLDQALQGVELDFFVLCSSLTAIHGGVGQVDYCAANLFLDAFAAQLRASRRRPALSVNWDTWQEVGMAVDTVLPRDMEQQRRESLELGILPREGAEALTRLVGRGLAQVAVSTTDLLAPEDDWIDGEAELSTTDDEHRSDDVQPTVYPRPALANDYVEPRDEVEAEIARVWTELLGVGPIGANDDFFELGGHSLLALQAVSRLRDALHVEMNVRRLFDTPTVASLAEAIKRVDVDEVEAQELVRALELVEGLSEDELLHRLSGPTIAPEGESRE